MNWLLYYLLRYFQLLNLYDKFAFHATYLKLNCEIKKFLLQTKRLQI